MIMLMAVAVAVFGAVMVWWSDIVAYIPPVRRKAY